MRDLKALNHSLKVLSYHHHMEHWNQDMFQSGSLCQTCELSHIILEDPN